MIGQDTFSMLLVPPVVGPQQKSWPSMSPSSTAVHGGQHDTKYVTFELLLHAAFIRGSRNWGDMLEPARRWYA